MGQHDEGYEATENKEEAYEVEQRLSWTTEEDAKNLKKLQEKLQEESHEQAWAEIQCTEECMKEEAAVKLQQEWDELCKPCPVWSDHVEGEPGRIPDSDDEGYGASMYLQDGSAVQNKEVVPVYNSLEEIAKDIEESMDYAKYGYMGYDVYMKLQNTISTGAYIKGDGKE